ncbi:hypothetical protein U1Q18_020347 [Sarracenia purpurea var. burkii]
MQRDVGGLTRDIGGLTRDVGDLTIRPSCLYCSWLQSSALDGAIAPAYRCLGAIAPAYRCLGAIAVFLWTVDDVGDAVLLWCVCGCCPFCLFWSNGFRRLCSVKMYPVGTLSGFVLAFWLPNVSWLPVASVGFGCLVPWLVGYLVPWLVSCVKILIVQAAPSVPCIGLD